MAETVSVSPIDLLIDDENPRIAQPNEGQHKAPQSLGRRRHGLTPDGYLAIVKCFV